MSKEKCNCDDYLELKRQFDHALKIIRDSTGCLSCVNTFALFEESPCSTCSIGRDNKELESHWEYSGDWDFIDD